ncbi:MAG: ABC transporter ATP-binding protein, partial [Chitinophagaceae bacterium]
MHKIIEVKDLSKQFSGNTVVDRLSFSVFKGDVFGFLGQNGAGKSTTIRMLLSLIRPTGGQIKIFDKDLLYHRNAILSGVGAVIEKPDLYKYLSGLDNLSLFARLSGKWFTRKELNFKLGQVGLEDRGRDKVSAYSQGMKQRLGIAVALVHDPDLIILDEPTNGLDPQGIADIRNLIRALSTDQQKSFLV